MDNSPSAQTISPPALTSVPGALSLTNTLSKSPVRHLHPRRKVFELSSVFWAVQDGSQWTNRPETRGAAAGTTHRLDSGLPETSEQNSHQLRRRPYGKHNTSISRVLQLFSGLAPLRLRFIPLKAWRSHLRSSECSAPPRYSCPVR